MLAQDVDGVQMDSVGVFSLAWPWIGIGAIAVFAVLLLGTDLLRGRTGPRWRDPVWLSWVLPPLLMAHQFEEYAMHVIDGQFALVTEFFTLNLFPGVPEAHFPLMNMVFAWLALPLAAYLGRRNTVVGLSGYGFILINGLTHLGAVATGVGGGSSFLSSPGLFTGVLVFLPLVILVCIAVIRDRILPTRGLVAALLAGALGHLALFLVYPLAAVGGTPAVVIGDVLVSFSPILFALLLTRLLRVPASGTQGAADEL